MKGGKQGMIHILCCGLALVVALYALHRLTDRPL